MSSCTSNTFKKMDIDSFVDVIKLDTLSDFYDIKKYIGEDADYIILQAVPLKENLVIVEVLRKENYSE